MDIFFRPVVDAKDYSVLQFTVRHPPHASNVAILWDDDRDLRVIRLLLAMRYRHPAIFSAIRAIAEHQGKVQVWYDRDGCERPRVKDLLQNTANDVLAPEDVWQVEKPKLVDCAIHNGGRIVLRDQLSPDDPLYIVPEHRLVGLVRP